MWIFKVIIFSTILIAGLFAFFSLGVSESARPFIYETQSILGVLPSWAWIAIAVVILGLTMSLAKSYFDKN